MRKQKKFPNQTVERLTAMRGILNMHERAQKKGELCKLNGESRTFDMGTWDCDMAACALGSASMNPWFKERGLYASKDVIDAIGFDSIPVYKGNRGCEAGAEFFGITLEESEYLFSIQRYEGNSDSISPEMVRDRVDELIKKYTP